LRVAESAHGATVKVRAGECEEAKGPIETIVDSLKLRVSENGRRVCTGRVC
jgi:hypothetical protein